MNFTELMLGLFCLFLSAQCKNGFVMVCFYNGKSVSFLFNFFLGGSRKGPRPKLKADATQVWVPTHSLKTSGLLTASYHLVTSRIRPDYLHEPLRHSVTQASIEMTRQTNHLSMNSAPMDCVVVLTYKIR